MHVADNFQVGLGHFHSEKSGLSPFMTEIAVYFPGLYFVTLHSSVLANVNHSL